MNVISNPFLNDIVVLDRLKSTELGTSRLGGGNIIDPSINLTENETNIFISYITLLKLGILFITSWLLVFIVEKLGCTSVTLEFNSSISLSNWHADFMNNANFSVLRHLLITCNGETSKLNKQTNLKYLKSFIINVIYFNMILKFLQTVALW